MEFNNDFKYDLKIGNIAEKKLADIFENKKIEIKYDKIAYSTGNIAIEYMSRNKPSGISTTQSDYYCYIIANTAVEDIYLIMEINKLKELCRKYYQNNSIKAMGDDNSSLSVLIPIKELISTYNIPR